MDTTQPDMLSPGGPRFEKIDRFRLRLEERIVAAHLYDAASRMTDMKVSPLVFMLYKAALRSPIHTEEAHNIPFAGISLFRSLEGPAGLAESAAIIYKNRPAAAKLFATAPKLERILKTITKDLVRYGLVNSHVIDNAVNCMAESFSASPETARSDVEAFLACCNRELAHITQDEASRQEILDSAVLSGTEHTR